MSTENTYVTEIVDMSTENTSVAEVVDMSAENTSVAEAISDGEQESDNDAVSIVQRFLPINLTWRDCSRMHARCQCIHSEPVTKSCLARSPPELKTCYTRVSLNDGAGLNRCRTDLTFRRMLVQWHSYGSGVRRMHSLPKVSEKNAITHMNYGVDPYNCRKMRNRCLILHK